MTTTVPRISPWLCSLPRRQLGRVRWRPARWGKELQLQAVSTQGSSRLSTRALLWPLTRSSRINLSCKARLQLCLWPTPLQRSRPTWLRPPNTLQVQCNSLSSPPCSSSSISNRQDTDADIKGFRVVVEPRVDAAAAAEVVKGASVVPRLQL